MQTKRHNDTVTAERRRRAEERLREEHADPRAAHTEADTQRLVHELQVHQIELEMQNEELEQARAEVEAALERFSDLYDFAPVGYVTLDRDGTIHEINLTGASLLGIERTQLVRRRLGSFIAADESISLHSFLTRIFEDRVRTACEVVILKAGRHPVQMRIEGAVAASGRECRVVLTDVTERNRAESEQLIRNKLESTGILAGGLAHDFNNLLTVILLHLELSQALAPRGEGLAHSLEEAKKAAWAARSLTQQLITFAKGGDPTRKPTRLAGVIRDAVISALSGWAQPCEFALEEALWTTNVDAGQIGQVIRNIVLNAREAMPLGGTVSVQAENVVLRAGQIPALPGGDYVRLSIADEGEGMAAELLTKIFDPYFSTKQRGSQKGMGLGLTICHSVIQAHEGAIEVESRQGIGTTFHIYLPAQRKRLDLAQASVPHLVTRPARILMMDDEDWVRNVVGVLLTRLGHEAEAVSEGRQAIEAYLAAERRGRPFDLVILDLTVPGGMGAQETIRALRKIKPGIKAMVMSRYGDDPAMVEPKAHGFGAALGKPFDIETLKRALAQVLGSQK